MVIDHNTILIIQFLLRQIILSIVIPKVIMPNVQEEKHDESSRSNSFNLFGIELEIDDLIIIAIICLLFLDFNKNYTLIIILGLILLNTNLGDLLNLF